MKKIDRFIEQIDHFIEKHSGTLIKIIKQYSFIAGTIFISGLFIIFIIKNLLDNSQERAFSLVQDLKQLERILSSIDKECNILSIINNRGLLNFFTVEKFIGSQVGCLNLAYPDRWKGPYLKTNPTFQGVFFELIKTDEGLFILPGDGVRLPNGVIMGESFVVRQKTSILSALKTGGALRFGDAFLATHLTFTIGDWDGRFFSSDDLQKVQKAIKSIEENVPPL